MEFKNRVYGAAIVKAINSNYNADFSGQPRRLPNGKVYATDKAFKYTIRNYIKSIYLEEDIFYFKSLNENLNPISLDESYIKHFGEYPTSKTKTKGKDKEKEIITKTTVAQKLLSCIDIRLFGATFTGKTNISLHGPVQINHGINIWHEDNIYTEQITSPFSNKNSDTESEKDKEKEKEATTIGRQSKLEEGHYVHHFSINPHNISDITNLIGNDANKLSTDDIEKLKEAMRYGATWYDSASKAGCENELLLWVQLKESSKMVLPNLTSLISVLENKKDNKVVFDFQKVKDVLEKNSDNIEKIEIYYNKASSEVININKAIEYDL